MELTALQSEGLLRGIIFAIEIVLAIILVAWMRTNQRGTKEPYRFLMNLVIWGGITAVISAIIEIKYSINVGEIRKVNPLAADQYGPIYDTVNLAVASLIEELAKYVVGVFVILSSRHFQKLSDSILYMILIGLGFSLAEDFIFLINPQTYAPYRLLSFYIHSGCAAVIGYSMGRFKFHLTGYGELFRAVFYAILLHFGYNISSNLENHMLAFWLSLMITIYITLQVFILFKKSIIEEYALEIRNRPKKKIHKLVGL